MQKKLIALAIAGLASTAAFAQTNVTLYGVADVSLESVSANNATLGNNLGSSGRVNSNGSFIGLKGTEDLGNGLKAIFVYENGFSADTGLNNTATRDSFVGLSGGFGMVHAGNLTTATRSLATRMEMLPGDAGVGTASSLLGNDSRLSNAVQYVSNDFNGFNFAAAYGFGEDKQFSNATPGTSVTNNSKTYDIGLNYTMGGWDFGYAYSRFSSNGDFVGFLDTGKNHLIGVGYTFDGGHKVTAQWEKTKTDFIGGGDADRTAYSLQGKFAVSPAGALIAEYNVARDISGTSDTGAKMYTVGYLHTLSKRTLVKALVTRINNEDNIGYDFADGAIGTGVGGVGLGSNVQALSLGVRHAF